MVQTCSLANKTSANCLPTASDLCVHTCQGLSITPAADINAAGQVIAAIKPEVVKRKYYLWKVTKELDLLNKIFLHRICYVKLFEAAKINVQIMRFMCCLNMVFT